MVKVIQERFDADPRVVTLSLAQLAESVGNSFIIIVMPLYIATELRSGGLWGADELLVTGLVLSLSGFVNAFIQPFSGRASDYFGRRKAFVLAGLALLATANAAYTLADTYVGVLGVRALQGVAGALIMPAAVALVSEYSTITTRGGNMGVYNTLRLVGFGAGPVAAGAVVNAGPYALAGVEVDGFTAAFYTASVAAALSLVLVSVFIRDPERDGEAEAARRTSLRVFDDAGGLDAAFSLGVASMFMAIGIALFATLQVEVNDRLMQTSTAFGLQFSAFILAQILLQTPFGRISDVYGRKWLVVVGMLALAPTTFAQGVVVTPVQMFVARLLQGVAGAMVFAPAFALVGDTAEGDAGARLSMLTMGFMLGVSIGPLSSGYLVSYGFVVPFAFASVLALVGAALVYTQVEETVDR
ncbi:MAG: MFS transporter [Halobacteriota archaeon]